jgi:hypothetical protein
VYGFFGDSLDIEATISDTTITGNMGGAGGAGTSGGAGGDAQGGGLFADGNTTVSLTGVSITGNKARGGTGGKEAVPGVSGTGTGGGVYLSGPGSTWSKSKIAGNSASTSDDDAFGSFS